MLCDMLRRDLAIAALGEGWSLDVLRQRGNNSAEHNARRAPHVLSFEADS